MVSGAVDAGEDSDAGSLGPDDGALLPVGGGGVPLDPELVVVVVLGVVVVTVVVVVDVVVVSVVVGVVVVVSTALQWSSLPRAFP